MRSTVILQYCWIKRLHRVETCIEMIQVYSVWSLNVSASQTLRYKISLFEFPLLKTRTEVIAETKRFLNKFNIDVSYLLMSSLRAIVICQKYCGDRVISSQIHLFAPLLNMRRCTLCTYIEGFLSFVGYDKVDDSKV